MEKLVSMVTLFCLLLVVAVSNSEADATANQRSRRQVTCGIPSIMTAAQKQQMIDGHNNDRSKEGASDMMIVTWSDELAARAQELTNTCVYMHSMGSDCSGGRLGQNLDMNPSYMGLTTIDMTRSTTKWNVERNNWNWATGSCNYTKGICGHWTQEVWPRAREIGCGVTECPTATGENNKNYNNVLIIACNYRNPANEKASTFFSPGETPCTDCDSPNLGGGYKCVNNLCVACSPTSDSECSCAKTLSCVNGGVWSSSTCLCACPAGFYGPTCASKCTCADKQPNTCPGIKDKCNSTGPATLDWMKSNCITTCNFPCILPPECFP